MFINVLCLSMYFMMDHNVQKYIKFLKIIQFLKLNYLYCKWRHFVLEQIEDLDKNVQIVVNEMNERNPDTVDSNFETRNQSVIQYRMEMPEASVPTLN